MKRFALAMAAAAAATTGAAGVAAAHDHTWYATLGYTHFDLEDASPGALTGRLGYNFSEHFAVEGEASLGILEDDFNTLGAKFDAKIEHALGLYVVGKLPVSEGVKLFGRVGYGTVEAEVTGLGVSASDSVDGFAVGVGGEVAVAEGWGIRGEYTRLEGDDSEADTFSVGAVFKF